MVTLGVCSTVVMAWLALGFPLRAQADCSGGCWTPRAGFDWAVENSSGFSEIFLIGQDSNAYHAWCCWSGWNPLPGATFRQGTALTAASNWDGRLQVFGLGSDGSVLSAWQTCTSCGWTSWISLGCCFVDSPKVGMNLDGTLEVFDIIQGDTAMWFDRQTSAGSPSWTGWTSLGGVWSNDLSVIQDSSTNDGRLRVLAVGNNHSLYDAWEGSANSNQWSPWQFLGGYWGSNGSNAGVSEEIPGAAVLSNQDVVAQVSQFDVGALFGGWGDVWQTWETVPGGSFTAPQNWYPLSSSANECDPNIDSNVRPVVWWPDWHLDSFASKQACSSTDNPWQLLHAWNSANNPTFWSAWSYMGRQAPAFNNNFGETLDVYAHPNVFSLNDDGSYVFDEWSDSNGNWTYVYLGGNWPAF